MTDRSTSPPPFSKNDPTQRGDSVIKMTIESPRGIKFLRIKVFCVRGLLDYGHRELSPVFFPFVLQKNQNKNIYDLPQKNK